MNYKKSLDDSQYKIVCQNFSDYGCQNTEKSVSLTASDIETFLKTEENQNMERKIESFVFSGFGNGSIKLP